MTIASIMNSFKAKINNLSLLTVILYLNISSFKEVKPSEMKKVKKITALNKNELFCVVTSLYCS